MLATPRATTYTISLPPQPLSFSTPTPNQENWSKYRRKTTLRLCFTDDIFVWQRGAAGEPVAPQGCPETPPADISSPRTSFGDPVQEEIAPLDWCPERHRLQRQRDRIWPSNFLSSTGRSPPLVPWLYPSVKKFEAIALN